MRWHKSRPVEIQPRPAPKSARWTLTRLYTEHALEMASYPASDVDLLACSPSEGLLRLKLPTTPPASPAGDPDAAWQRLAATGELRLGPPTAAPGDALAPDELAATWLPSGAPVTLSGELAILVALRSRPGVVADVLARTGDVVDLQARWYVGTKPPIVLQETAGVDGLLDFRGLCTDQTEKDLWELLFQAIRKVDPVKPSEPRQPMAAADAATLWRASATITAARASGPDVVVRTLQFGIGHGIWLVDSGVDTTTATPVNLSDVHRVTQLLELPASTPSWLYPDRALQP